MIRESTKLSDVILGNLNLLAVLSCFDIRPGTKEMTIGQVCGQKGIDAGFLLAILNTYTFDDYFPRIEDIDASKLIEYLKRTHRYYAEVTLPGIDSLIQKLIRNLPSEKTPRHIEKYFNVYRKEITKHMKFEEKFLFPVLKDLMAGKRKNRAELKEFFGKLDNDHTNVEEKLKDLKTILVRYIPAKADEHTVFELLYTLSVFDKDHFNHSSFEDKILIPKLKQLLKTSAGRNAD
ncbi:MAG: hemerythrin domain-containing protein [Bacteroidetes bacterium]|nr:hemerythrin domain-containing protein [Bacteroidota bacterium]